MDVRQWVKTEEGIARIESEKPWCMNGCIWQGFRGTVTQARENTMSIEELRAIDDLDGTMHEVWQRRKARLEGRFARKIEEYDQRRLKLRGERSAIREALKEDKALGITASPDDMAQIERINKRMARLSDLAKEEELAIATAESGAQKPQPVDETVKDPKDFACPECSKTAPFGRDPERWLRGHMVGAHKSPRLKKEATA